MPGAIWYKTFPEIHLGGLSLHTFGLLVGLGVLIGVFMVAQHMEKATGLDRDVTYRFCFWLVLIGFVMARVTYDITNWRDIHSAVDLIAVWKGGLQFSGGFLGGIVYAVIFLRRHPEIDHWRLLDGVALGLTAGLAVGRIGCYSVGEHLGGKTSFFLGVKYMGGVTRENCPLNGGPCFAVGDTIHNTALYEMLSLAVLLGLLVWLRHRGRMQPGALFAVFLGWYSVSRFSTDFLRAYDRIKFGLTGAQWMMIGIFIGTIYVTWRLLQATPAVATAGVDPEAVEAHSTPDEEVEVRTASDKLSISGGESEGEREALRPEDQGPLRI